MILSLEDDLFADKELNFGNYNIDFSNKYRKMLVDIKALSRSGTLPQQKKKLEEFKQKVQLAIKEI